MKVIKFPVSEEPELIEVPNELRALQNLVGGHIQFMQTEPDMGLLVDEEGLLKGLPKNGSHPIYGELYGTVIVVGTSGEGFCDVPQDYVCSVFGEDGP